MDSTRDSQKWHAHPLQFGHAPLRMQTGVGLAPRMIGGQSTCCLCPWGNTEPPVSHCHAHALLDPYPAIVPRGHTSRAQAGPASNSPFLYAQGSISRAKKEAFRLLNTLTISGTHRTSDTNARYKHRKHPQGADHGASSHQHTLSLLCPSSSGNAGPLLLPETYLTL